MLKYFNYKQETLFRIFLLLCRLSHMLALSVEQRTHCFIAYLSDLQTVKNQL